MAEEEIKDIEVSIGRIHMVLAWLHTFFVLAAPGADEAGVIPEGRDESPNSFRRIEGQSIKPRLRFQCMYCCLTKFLRSFNKGRTMCFGMDVSKKVGKPFGFSNPVSLKITRNMEASDKQACGDHTGCLMHRLFKTVIGGVNCLSQEDLKSLRAEVILPDKTKIRKIERELKMLEGAHLNSLNTIRGLDVDAYFLNDEAAEAEAARIAAEAEAEAETARPAKTEKRKAPKTKDPKIVKDKRPDACAGTPSVSAFGVTVTPSLSVFGSTTPPPLTRLLLHAYSTTPPPLTVSTTASPAPQTREEQLKAKVKKLRAQKQRLTAQLAEAMTQAASNAQTAPPGEALQDKHG